MSLSRLPLRLSVFSTPLFNSFWLILARGSLLTPARLERRAFYSNVSQCWCNVSMPFYCMTLFPAADYTDSIVPRFFLFVIFKLPRGYIYRGSKYNNNNLYFLAPLPSPLSSSINPQHSISTQNGVMMSSEQFNWHGELQSKLPVQKIVKFESFITATTKPIIGSSTLLQPANKAIVVRMLKSVQKLKFVLLCRQLSEELRYRSCLSVCICPCDNWKTTYQILMYMYV